MSGELPSTAYRDLGLRSRPSCLPCDWRSFQPFPSLHVLEVALPRQSQQPQPPQLAKLQLGVQRQSQLPRQILLVLLQGQPEERIQQARREPGSLSSPWNARWKQRAFQQTTSVSTTIRLITTQVWGYPTNKRKDTPQTKTNEASLFLEPSATRIEVYDPTLLEGRN